MDPVHKWIMVIVLFMAAAIFAAFKIGAAGSWQMQVVPYSSTHDMIYVLNTKTGEIQGKLHSREKHVQTRSDGNYAHSRWQTVRNDKDQYSYDVEKFLVAPPRE